MKMPCHYPQMKDDKTCETSKEKKMDEQKVVSMTDKEPTKMQMLDQWLADLIYPGKGQDFFQEVAGHGDDKETSRTFRFYTEEHVYTITAIERNDGNGDDYLSCGVSARKARAGEDWLRGNDLPDGPFTLCSALFCQHRLEDRLFRQF